MQTAKRQQLEKKETSFFSTEKTHKVSYIFLLVYPQSSILIHMIVLSFIFFSSLQTSKFFSLHVFLPLLLCVAKCRST